VAARERVLNELRAVPPHLQKPRLADADVLGSVRTPGTLRTSGTQGTTGWWRPVASLAAAAALIVIVATVSLQRAEWLATVEAADGSKYTLKPNTVLTAKDPRGLQLTLKDGARVEMRSAAELSLEAAPGGIGIRLLAGDIIVNAVDQRDRHLSVQTRDMSIVVAGTMSLVKAVEDGSRVAAITGNVRVHERGLETVLRPGEQFSTSPTLAARPLRDDIVWSRNADAHLAMLDSFMTGIARTTGPLTRLAPQAGVQTPPVPNAAIEFEEASIRECDPNNLPALPPGTRGGGANSMLATPGRWYGLCLTPATLIRTAFGYQPVGVEALLPGGLPGRGGRGPLSPQFGAVAGLGIEDGIRVRGGPDWAHKQQYTIEAVTSEMPSPSAATMRGPMLRALLERRFKLKTHVETEQTRAYNLVVAPGGLKIKPAASGSCAAPAARPGEQLVNGQPVQILAGGGIVVGGGAPRDVADVRRDAKPPCGVANGPHGPNCVSIGGEATFDQLLLRLRLLLGNGIGVTDKTGITDKFNWDLEYAVDGNVSDGCRGIRLTDAGGGNVQRASTIFDALEQQLGLRLEPTQVPREYLVIDSIERPGPN
jgi:uncharacterized protein (TIGR03435 family)